MANSDKNIVITPNIGQTDDPKIVFSGANTSVTAQDISLYAYPTDNGTLSFEGTAGQLFSITNNLTGTIFSVNDISGIPSIEVDDDGTIRLAEFAGNVLIGTATDNGTDALQVDGSVLASGGNLTYGLSSAPSLTLGVNTTAAGTIKLWGGTSASYGLIQQTTSNLHIDTNPGSLYLNFYDGNGVFFGNGASGVVAVMGPDGDLWKGGNDNTGSRYFHDAYHPNADTLTTARTIGGVSFNGSANINLPGVNTAGNQSTSGNATTATTFSTTRTNYKGVTDNAVIGQLMWKNYGNSHTIFDASAGTTPSGTAKNNTNPDVTWTATYPTLMGWNGTSTYGVRVDISRFAEQLKTARTINGVSFNGSANITVADATKLPLTGGTVTGDLSFGSGANIHRTTHSSGYLVGSYNSVGANSTRTNPIYTIGSSYQPNDGDLVNMYGIGYTNGAAAYDGINTVLSGWGMYVAADGDARIGLDGSNGIIRCTGVAYVNTNQRVFADNYHPNADTLTTARSINGVSFNGSANITLPTVNTSGNQTITGAKTFSTGIDVTGTAGLDMNNNDIFGVDQIFHHGDTNTYIQFHAADQFRVVTGGVERLEVNNSAVTVAGSTQLLRLGVGTAASGTTGEIRATNNVTAFFSDKRLKTDITPITDALSKVCSISGVTFKSNDIAAKYGYTDQKLQVGVIAQEIQKVLPQVVVAAPFDIGQKEDGIEYSVSGENFLTVQYDKLVPLLIEAIKELKNEIESLKTEISNG